MKNEDKRVPRIKPHEEEDEFSFRDYQLAKEKEDAEESERLRVIEEEEDAKDEAEIYYDLGPLDEEELAELGITQGEHNAKTKGK